MKVLIVEDDRRIVSFLVKGLNAEGFTTAVAYDGHEALEALSVGDEGPDLVLLDLGLPGMSGYELLGNIRDRSPALPVIILTARGEVEDKVRGLNLGANDYVTKPFSFAERVARARSALRTSEQSVPTELVVRDLHFDLLTKTAHRNGRRIELAQREWAMLELFMRHPTHVMSRAQIMNEVFGYDFDVASNVVDVYVGYLRRKLNASDEEPLIVTVRGAGYRLVAP